MLQDATDVPTRCLGQVGVSAFSEEQRFTALPKTLVNVHASAVVVKHRLRHEGGRFAIFLGNVPNDVLVNHDVVGSFNQLRELHAQFVLPCTGDFVVVLFNGNAQLGHEQQHFGANVLSCVIRGYREVALLGLDFVSKVATLFNATCVPAGPIGRSDRSDHRWHRACLGTQDNPELDGNTALQLKKPGRSVILSY